MHSKVMILIWERWQRTRWALMAACLLPLIGRLLWVLGHTTQEKPFIFTITYLYPGYTLLIMFLLVGQCGALHLDLAFPNRLFRFPVRTTTLLSVYMGYGIIAVSLPLLILLGFEKLFFDSINHGWSTFLILETVYIALQTLSWLGGPARFLCLALSLTFVYALLKFAAWFNLPVGANILCTIIILLCGAISFWSVSKHRHGAWISGWQWVDSFLEIFRKSPSKRFASAVQAQIWFELKQTGHLFPISSLCFIGPILGLSVGLVMYYEQFMPVSPLVPNAFFFTLPAAFIAGLLSFAVYYRDHASGASNFWLRHPMATRTLAVARMHAMAWSLVRVLTILTMITLAVVAYDWAIGKLDVKTLSPVRWALEYGSPLEVITMTLLGLYAFVLFYWTLLRLAPALGVGGIVVFNITRLIRSLIGDIAMSWVWTALVVGLPVAVLFAFYVARRRNLITTTTLVIAACVFPVVVISLWSFPWWSVVAFGLPKGLPDLNQVQIIRLISAATLPFIPLVATPLLMERLRHR